MKDVSQITCFLQVKSKPKAEKVNPRDDDSEEARRCNEAELEPEDDIEKEKEKDKMAFLNAIKGLREKDKGKAGPEDLEREFRTDERARDAAQAAAQAHGRLVPGPFQSRAHRRRRKRANGSASIAGGRLFGVADLVQV